jgi:hypothetical protein
MLDFKNVNPLAIFLFLIIIGSAVFGYLLQVTSTYLPAGELKAQTIGLSSFLILPIQIILGIVIIAAIIIFLFWLYGIITGD